MGYIVSHVKTYVKQTNIVGRKLVAHSGLKPATFGLHTTQTNPYHFCCCMYHIPDGILSHAFWKISDSLFENSKTSRLLIKV